jgi:membrane protein
MSIRAQHHRCLRQIGLREWRLVAVQSLRDLSAGSVLEWASSLAFYGFISVFPLLIGILIVASTVVDAAWATHHATELLGHFLPEGDAQISKILDAAIAERQRVGLLSLPILMVTGRRILGVLTKGLNHVSDVSENDDPLRRRIAVELTLFTGVVGLILLALASRPVLRLAWGAVNVLPGPTSPLAGVLFGAIRILLLLTIFCLVYALVPRGERMWRASLAGAVLATAFYLMAEGIFGMVADHVWTNLRLIYGPLALAALLLSWTWYVSLITLVGGGFASHVKVMLLEQASPARARREHVER